MNNFIVIRQLGDKRAQGAKFINDANFDITLLRTGVALKNRIKLPINLDNDSDDQNSLEIELEYLEKNIDGDVIIDHFKVSLSSNAFQYVFIAMYYIESGEFAGYALLDDAVKHMENSAEFPYTRVKQFGDIPGLPMFDIAYPFDEGSPLSPAVPHRLRKIDLYFPKSESPLEEISYYEYTFEFDFVLGVQPYTDWKLENPNMPMESSIHFFDAKLGIQELPLLRRERLIISREARSILHYNFDARHLSRTLLVQLAGLIDEVSIHLWSGLNDETYQVVLDNLSESIYLYNSYITDNNKLRALISSFNDYITRFKKFRTILDKLDENDQVFEVVQIMDKFMLKALDADLRIRVLKRMISDGLTGNYLEEEKLNDLSEELLAIKLLKSFISSSQPSDEELDNNTRLLDSLRVISSDVDPPTTYLNQLFNEFECFNMEGTGTGSRKEFLDTLYAIWTQSRYNPLCRGDYYEVALDENNEPVLEDGIYIDAVEYNLRQWDEHFPYSTSEGDIIRPALFCYKVDRKAGFTFDGYKFSFIDGQGIQIYREGFGFYPFYDYFQPISLIGIPDTVTELPVTVLPRTDKLVPFINGNCLPMFYLAIVDEQGESENIAKMAEYTVDVLSTVSGVGNLLNIRHLWYLAKFEKYARTGFGALVSIGKKIKVVGTAVEAPSSLLSIYMNINNNHCPDYPVFCDKLSGFLSALELATLSGDLLACRYLQIKAQDFVSSIDFENFPSGVSGLDNDYVLDFESDWNELPTAKFRSIHLLANESEFANNLIDKVENLEIPDDNDLIDWIQNDLNAVERIILSDFGSNRITHQLNINYFEQLALRPDLRATWKEVSFIGALRGNVGRLENLKTIKESPSLAEMYDLPDASVSLKQEQLALALSDALESENITVAQRLPNFSYLGKDSHGQIIHFQTGPRDANQLVRIISVDVILRPELRSLFDIDGIGSKGQVQWADWFNERNFDVNNGGINKYMGINGTEIIHNTHLIQDIIAIDFRKKLLGYEVISTSLIRHEGVSFRFWRKSPPPPSTQQITTLPNSKYDKFIIVAQKSDDSKVRRVLNLQVKGVSDSNSVVGYKAEKYTIETFDQSWIPDKNDLEFKPVIGKTQRVPDYRNTPHIYPKSLIPNQVDGDSSIRIGMTGTQRGDWEQFWALNGYTSPPFGSSELKELKKTIRKTYTLHHMNDFDPETLSCTVQLVKKTAHDKRLVEGIAHEGAVSEYRKYTGTSSY